MSGMTNKEFIMQNLSNQLAGNNTNQKKRAMHWLNGELDKAERFEGIASDYETFSAESRFYLNDGNAEDFGYVVEEHIKGHYESEAE